MTAFDYLESSDFSIADEDRARIAQGTTMITALSQLRTLVREDKKMARDEFMQAAKEQFEKLAAVDGQSLDLDGFLTVCEGIWADAR